MGEAGSAEEALGSMRTLAASSALDAPPTPPSAFHLCFQVRRSQHEMDVTTAEVEALARLDELPEVVRRKLDADERRR